ncbi:MAG TPA: glycosyl transferase [Myxococcota bacterium]|nr:glycosyl transferase [Myxococcota bacterium]
MSELPPLECASDPAPHARILSNGRWTALATGTGTGTSAWRGLALSRAELDRVEDPAGIFVYVRDLDAGELVSIGQAPCGGDAEFRARYSPGLVELARESRDLAADLAICVHPEQDVELRRIRVTNLSARQRRLEVTALAEIVLHPRLAQEAHPAFAKLFVETAFDAGAQALLARRRPRSKGEPAPWLAAALAGPGELRFETARARFLGRGRSLARPRALDGGALSGSLGSVLDPVFAMQRGFVLEPGGSAELAFVFAAAETRDAACALLRDGEDPAALEKVFTWAALAERARLGRVGLDEARAESLQELAGAALYGHPALRAEPSLLVRARGPLRLLDRLGVRRDGALAVVPADAASDPGLMKEVEQAEAYWRALGLPIEVRVLRASEHAGDDHDRLLAWASLVWDAPLEALLARLEEGTRTLPEPRAGAPPAASRPARPPPAGGPPPAKRDAHLPATRFGGFAPDGDEFVIGLDGTAPDGGERPPMPWTNVVANERAGFIASESGAACTWARNSRENKLTPWANDPQADPHGEALWVRDLARGDVWSPQPGPAPGGAAYEVRHGFGYTTWRHESHGLAQETTAFVPREDPLRILELAVADTRGRARELSLVSYARLVLGALVSESARFVATEWDAEAGILFARGVGDERADEVVFAAAVAPAGAALRATADRAAFLGRPASLARPAALDGAAPLDGAAGAGLDACAALEVRVRVPARGEARCAFLLGEAASEAEARALVARYREPGAVADALARVRAFWTELRGTLRVETPMAALDAMANGWLLYQTLSCRLWARSAFYQSGGAFGFRDQLQDASALLLHRPDLTRAQILLHAAHQFREGDVLHWWHPPSGRGTRTHFSDDLLWLPFIASHYVATTGDAALLDELAPFASARALAPGEDEAFLAATLDDGPLASVYEHCVLAIERSMGRGAHGLPLMGTGDWNDGMNRVGREGRGESVWLGFFLHQILGAFAPYAEARGDAERAARWRAEREQLSAALEDAWDGAWFRRAYFDDGTALGTAAGDECRIDVLPQAWAVLTGAVSRERAVQAMESARRELVSPEEGMIRLLAPPFDKTPLDPGYIKGYVPGIRENGGQYTHGAMWLLRAMAELGWREEAAPLLEQLTPVWHARDDAAIDVYQVEPYVVAADVYGAPPHVGRGGWTWYTGSAGWMLRVLVESILGLTLHGGAELRVRPCIPDAWPGFRMTWRRVEIEVTNPRGRSESVVACTVDGAPAPIADDGSARIALRRDGGPQRVLVELGPAR